MRCYLNLLVPMMVLAPLCGIAALAQGTTYSLGRAPTTEEVRAWDIAVGSDGKELPPGSGTAKVGAEVFAKKCAACHGPTGEGTGPAGGEGGGPGRGPRLVGGAPLNPLHPVKTIGSYWPFATTVWDYINKGMPPQQEGSLSADEVYALTAFLLYRNGIIQESDVLDAKSLPKVQMPNRNGFVPARWEDIRLPRCPRGVCP